MPTDKCSHQFHQGNSCLQWRPSQKTTTNENTELWSPAPVDKSTKQLLFLSLKDYCRRGDTMIVRATGTGSLL